MWDTPNPPSSHWIHVFINKSFRLEQNHFTHDEVEHTFSDSCLGDYGTKWLRAEHRFEGIWNDYGLLRNAETSTSSISISSPDIRIGVWQTCGRSGHLQVLSLWIHTIWVQWSGHGNCWNLVGIVNSFSTRFTSAHTPLWTLLCFFSLTILNAQTNDLRLLWKMFMGVLPIREWTQVPLVKN